MSSTTFKRALPPPAAEAYDGLVVESLTVRFGAVKANDDVSMHAAAGTVTGVIGPNGAGKSTFMDAVGGFLPAAGRVLMNGADMNGLSPHRRAKLGLGRTFQSAGLFDDLTVAENLAVAGPPGHAGRELATTVLAQVGVSHLSAVLPRSLTVGQRRLVSLARALMLRPKVLLMDEPAAGLSHSERESLGRTIAALAEASRTAVVLVDHDVDLVLGVSSHIYVLSAGRLLVHGDPASIRASQPVREAYLGGAIEEHLA